jgi:SSS family solute:Na+ symporter
MSSLDIIVLIAYVLLVTGFGFLFYRRASDVEGFVLAHRRLPGWVVGLSIFGTYLSSISFLALPGKAYMDNWSAFAFSLSLPIATWMAARWFVPLYRATQDVSAYAYLERRFGLWARLYALTFYLLTQLARMGTIFFLVALALERLTGWDLASIIIVTGFLVTIYTMVGGIEAVIWTDAVQSVILTLGAVVSLGMILWLMPGGAGQVLAIAADSDKLSLGSFEASFTTPGFWLVILYGLFINLQNFGIDQSYIQRYKTARSMQDARRSVWIGALTYIPVSALFLFVGTALFAFYQVNPDLLPAALAGTDMGDRVFPHFIVDQLPAGLTGLVIAALFAAAMSSADTSMNSSATLLMNDVYVRIINPDLSPGRRINFLRIVTIALGSLGTATALLMISIKGALDAWWSLAGIFSGGMLGLFLLGILSRRTRSVEAGIAVAIGVLVIAWASLSPGADAWWANPLHSFMTIIIGTLAIFLGGVLLSRKRQRMARQEPPLTLFDLG